MSQNILQTLHDQYLLLNVTLLLFFHPLRSEFIILFHGKSSVFLGIIIFFGLFVLADILIYQFKYFDLQMTITHLI